MRVSAGFAGPPTTRTAVSICRCGLRGSVETGSYARTRRDTSTFRIKLWSSNSFSQRTGTRPPSSLIVQHMKSEELRNWMTKLASHSNLDIMAGGKTVASSSIL